MTESSRPLYFDHHATTPVDPRVLDAMLPYFSERFGNAASKTHAFGWEASDAVDEARATIARCIGAGAATDIVFTSGATESDNLAVKGVFEHAKDDRNHIVTTAIEHHAIHDSCRHLERQGARVTVVPVQENGIVDPDAIAAAVDDRTALVSVMLVNGEVGTVQPVEVIAKIAHAAGALFHTDAVQGIGRTAFDVTEMGVDIASITAHKIYGPKGVGALYVRSDPPAKVIAQIDGGGQERGMRSGTLNVPSIVGFAKAIEIMTGEAREESGELAKLRDQLLQQLRAGLGDVAVNGDLDNRVAANLNVSIAMVPSHELVKDLTGVAISTGSACTSSSVEPSYVLKAMGIDDTRAKHAIRFGLGRSHDAAAVGRAAELVIAAATKIRERSPLWNEYVAQRSGK